MNVEVVNTVVRLRQRLDDVRRRGRTIGFVPTMGALHEGHLSLVRTAKAECDSAVVSIYVNPTQFGPQEDFARYPRTLEADLELLAGAGGDLVFAPADAEVYRAGHDTWVTPGRVAEPLEGQCRPGHFRGVATVVLKLLNMVGPDMAYFGHKDYQQAVVIRRMVEDLSVPVAIRICPTVREPDGLAMSSRNRYLSPEARARALTLWKSLSLAADLVRQGQTDASQIVQRMREVLNAAAPVQIDYVALVGPETLEPVEQIRGPTLAAVAAKIDGTRLIDNCILRPS